MRYVKARNVIQYTLQKQHLLENSRAETILQVVEDIVALHATNAATPYLSLFARMKRFHRSDLDREYYAKRNLVRLECMRGTLFITSTEMAPLLFQATRISDDRIADWIRQWGIPHSEYQKITEYLYSLLKGEGQTLPAIKSALPEGLVRSLERRVGKSVYRMSNVNIVLTTLMRQGLVVSEKFSEPILTRSANRYALIRDAYPQLNLKSIEIEEAKSLLIKLYIRAFGPVTEGDIIWWTGLQKREVDEALATMELDLRQIRIKGYADDYIILETDFKNLGRFKPSRKPSILLLPYEDPYSKGYKVRNRLINPDYESKAYVGSAVEPTLLVDGQIIGTWNRTIEEGKGPIKLTLFKRIKKGVEKTLIRTARAIGKMMGDDDARIEINAR